MSRFVQVFNPKSKQWIKVDRTEGRVLGPKKDGSKWENVRTVESKN